MHILWLASLLLIESLKPPWHVYVYMPMLQLLCLHLMCACEHVNICISTVYIGDDIGEKRRIINFTYREGRDEMVEWQLYSTGMDYKWVR